MVISNGVRPERSGEDAPVSNLHMVVDVVEYQRGGACPQQNLRHAAEEVVALLADPAVAPDLVAGTLVQAWDRLEALMTPGQRAVFVIFAVSEVHPFADGNGRVARIAMAAELAAGAEVSVTVPTIARNDYLAALRRLSRQDRPDLLIDLFDRLQRFTAGIDFSSSELAEQQLSAANAFVDASDAERRGIHLRMPGR